MPPGKSRNMRDDTSEGDLEGFDLELEKLQRKYRIMEGDRQAYALESQDQIRKQLTEIDNLKSERGELIKNLSLAESKFNQEKDKINIASLQKLLDKKDECLNEIDHEKRIQQELNEQIHEWEKKVQQQRKKMGGAEATRSFAQHTQKRMSVLEGRLHRALSKFNSTLTQNSSLRDQIETLRIEKGRYQQFNKKLSKELKDLKRDIQQVIEASTLAYDQRDEAHSKIFLLKEKSEKDLQLFSAEIKELQRVIDNDKKLREFMMAKGVNRTPGSGAGRKSRDAKKGEGIQSIESYEAAFSEIEQITEKTDIDEIVTNFINVEDRNFALFNYVNEQNNEIERLQDIIDQIMSSITTFRDEGCVLEEDRAKILADLEKSTESAAEKCADNETLLAATLKILEQLKSGIGSLFNRLGCDSEVLSDLLGSSDGVKDDNIMQYLGLIEMKANELLSAQSFLESQDYDKPYDPQETARIILGQVPIQPVQPLLIAPPSTGDLRRRAERNKLIAHVLNCKEKDDDTEEDLDLKSDEENRPLTPGELKKRIMKGVLRKEAAATKKGFRYDLSAANRK